MPNLQHPDDYRLLIKEAIEAALHTGADQSAARLLIAAELIDQMPDEEERFHAEMAEFERQMETAAYVTVYHYIGSPTLQPQSTLSEEELTVHLNTLLDLLADHNVFVDFVTDVDDAEIYRFLVEDLMAEEIQEVRLPGWNLHFVYEEFFPEKYDHLAEDDLGDDISSGLSDGHYWDDSSFPDDDSLYF